MMHEGELKDKCALCGNLIAGSNDNDHHQKLHR